MADAGPPRTKDEVIEAIARFLAEVKWPRVDWERELYPSEREDFLKDARDLWPLVVEFVAGWIEANVDGGSWVARDVAAEVREEMT